MRQQTTPTNGGTMYTISKYCLGIPPDEGGGVVTEWLVLRYKAEEVDVMLTWEVEIIEEE